MAHYDCSCCGESMGISHGHCDNCQAGKCHRSSVYQPGDIVRFRDKWGVVSVRQFADVPSFIFHTDDGWSAPISSLDKDISTPFDHNYEGVPDEVLAKATELKLTENLPSRSNYRVDGRSLHDMTDNY